MKNNQTNQVNIKKRVLVSGDRCELPYIRRIQTLLENEYGYITYINELSAVENLHSNAEQVNADRIQESLIEESLSHNEVIIVTTSQWRRKMLQETLDAFKRLGREDLNPFTHFSTIYFLDIDDCWLYSGDELQNYLASALHLSLQGKRSPLWDKSISLNDLPPREHVVLNYALMLLKEFDEVFALEAVYKTHGEIIGLIRYLGVTKIARFNNSRPASMLMTEAIIGKIVEVFFWRNKDGLTYNQSYKNKALDKILFIKHFHMYAPHILRGEIFISHSTANLPVIRHLQLVAEEAGFRTFAFRLGILEDAQWLNINDFSQVARVLSIIKKEIDSCDFVLLADSPEARLTPWTFAEQVIANNCKKPVYKINISNLGLLDFFARNTELQKLFSSLKNSPYLDKINISTDDLKFIMVAQHWLDSLTANTDSQIADMIRIISRDYRVQLSAYRVFRNLCISRLSDLPDILGRLDRINEHLL